MHAPSTKIIAIVRIIAIRIIIRPSGYRRATPILKRWRF